MEQGNTNFGPHERSDDHNSFLVGLMNAWALWNAFGPPDFDPGSCHLPCLTGRLGLFRTALCCPFYFLCSPLLRLPLPPRVGFVE